MKVSGSRAIIECLHEQGVDTVFGYPGGTILPLYDALHDSSIRHILTVHEQGAAHAADGYARSSGRVGVCIATSGPGATNLITGLAAAYMDSVPIVAITGQVHTTLIGRDAFQEVDITTMTMPVTKHNFQVREAAQLVKTIRDAFYIARQGRPGPVLIEIPRDIQTTAVDYDNAPQNNSMRAWNATAEACRMVTEAALTINKASFSVMLVGGGAVCSGIQDELVTLAEKCNIPVVSTLMGLGAFPAYHPNFMGMTGMHGHKCANNLVHRADTIIAVGTRFSDRVTGDRTLYASDKKIIHLDIDEAEIGKNVETYIGLVGNLRQLLPLLTENLTRIKQTAIRQTICGQQLKSEELDHKDRTLNALAIMCEINAQTSGEPVIYVTDVGQHQMWAAQNLKINTPRTWITSGGLGAMGFGMPAAMGAQLANPDKRVILLVGDGGFKMTGMELCTIAAHNIPVITIIVNNHGLGMIRQLQQAFFNKRYTSCGTEHKMDFVMFAKSFDLAAAEANSQDEFSSLLARARSSSQPWVIVANTPDDELVNPMVAPGGAVNNYLDL